PWHSHNCRCCIDSRDCDKPYLLSAKKTVMKNSSKKRLRRERNFKRLGLATLCFTVLFLGFIFGKIIYSGYPAFLITEINIESHQPELLNAHAPYFIKKGQKWIIASDAVDMYIK